MLNVDRRHHVDAGVEQLEHVFIALAILAAGHVGVRQLVDDDRIGMAREDRVNIHLFQADAAVGYFALWDSFEVADAGLGVFAPCVSTSPITMSTPC